MPEIHVGTLLAGLLFGTIGFIAFRYGRKRALWKPIVIRLGLVADQSGVGRRAVGVPRRGV